MSRKCHFCHRWFGNKQAVRRHLGYCDWYKRDEVKPVLSPWFGKMLGPLAANATMVASAAPMASTPVMASAGPTATSMPLRASSQICASCGSAYQGSGVCRCGGRMWIPIENKPRQCPTCHIWIATDGRSWNGRCDECGEPISA